jgi:hypothetical protein
MSFDTKFDNRWKNVIEPAIKEVGLYPYRVDQKTISDSIITEIITGISKCRLFFADVTTLAHCEDRVFRNENVLYEVGIAHSRRLPEEVVLFRSDDDRLLFDLANIRVNPYNPDEKPTESKKLVKEALYSAIKEIDLQKHHSIKYAVESLTYDGVQFILDLAINDNKLKLYRIKSTILASGGLAMRSVSIQHLISLGVLSIKYPELESGVLKPDDKKYEYTLTSFGKIVAEVVADKYGLKCDL